MLGRTSSRQRSLTASTSLSLCLRLYELPSMMSTEVPILTGMLRHKVVFVSRIFFRDLKEDLARHGYLLPDAEDSFLHRLLVRRGEFICALMILFFSFSPAYQLAIILIEVAQSSLPLARLALAASLSFQFAFRMFLT